MTDRLVEPTTPEEQAEADYGDHVIWRLVGSTILQFGANDRGEILLVTRKGDEVSELIIGLDENGQDIALYEVEKKEQA